MAGASSPYFQTLSGMARPYMDRETADLIFAALRQHLPDTIGLNQHTITRTDGTYPTIPDSILGARTVVLKAHIEGDGVVKPVTLGRIWLTEDLKLICCVTRIFDLCILDLSDPNVFETVLRLYVP